MDDEIILTNENGCSASFIPLGARWVSMYAPDRNGSLENVVLGFESKKKYLNAEEQYHGAVVGRYCGRIAYGKNPCDGIDLNLTLNLNDKHHIHGGVDGFHLQNWQVKSVDIHKVVFSHTSKDGHEGYPGNVEVEVSYMLTTDDQIIFEVTATTDKKTSLNITNHAFFNLSGHSQTIVDHNLWINGDILNQDVDYLLTGKVHMVEAPYYVPLLGEVSKAFHLKSSDKIPQVLLTHPLSGRYLKIKTNQPSVQLYNGFFMTGEDLGIHGRAYISNSGLAIEPQFLRPGCLRTVLPHKNYYHKTIYEFGVMPS